MSVVLMGYSSGVKKDGDVLSLGATRFNPKIFRHMSSM